MTNITRKLATFAGILFVAMALGCASTAKQEGTGEYVDDTVITTKVKAAILNEPTLKSAEINVETFKGVVQLSGFVSSQAAENKAVEVARTVGGVKSVKNDMRLKYRRRVADAGSLRYDTPHRRRPIGSPTIWRPAYAERHRLKDRKCATDSSCCGCCFARSLRPLPR